jgi:hypothetical protein
VQGEAVFIPCSTAATAITYYRQRFNAGDIAASHNLATAAVGRMKAAQALEQYKEQVRQMLAGLLVAFVDGDEDSSFDEGMATAHDQHNARIRQAAAALGLGEL